MSPSYANGCGEAFPANITVFRPHSARFFARKSRRPTQLCIQGRAGVRPCAFLPSPKLMLDGTVTSKGWYSRERDTP